MPIFKINGELAHFAHVPKCAGSSIEEYLEARFGPVAFLDRMHFTVGAKESWTRTSPQHAPAAAMARLFPDGFLRHRFGVVRHPASRIASAFRFNREVNHRIFRRMPFDLWLWRLEHNVKIDHGFFDYHFLPQSVFMTEDYKVFRLEDGLDAVVDYLDGIAGRTAPGLSIGHENRTEGPQNGTERPPPLTDAQIRRIERIYARDYERFGYERQFPDR